MKKLMTLLLTGMMLLGMVTVAGATTISSIDDGFGGFFGPLTASGTATVGQTFRLSVEDSVEDVDIGDNNLLDSVTFWIDVSAGDIEFKFYLYEWDGINLTIIGGPLFESGPMSTTQSCGVDGDCTVDVGGVELNVDQDYVFFISVSSGSGNINTVFYLDWLGMPDPTSAHKFVSYNPISTEWNISPFDMAFEMVLSASEFEPEFEPEPEPEPAAAFELTRAKVDLKKGKIKVDGQVVLPEGVTCEDLAPEGSVKLSLFEIKQLVEAVDESVEELIVVDESVNHLEVKGRNGEKWEYKNRHVLGVTEYKVHWKDDQTGKVKIKADFDPGPVDLSQLTPKLVVEITLGDLAFVLTINENGQYDCKLKKKKWDFHNKP